eukprot:scaffold22597_cov127-Cylindrotheca_fusiformis.AAC.8
MSDDAGCEEQQPEQHQQQQQQPQQEMIMDESGDFLDHDPSRQEKLEEQGRWNSLHEKRRGQNNLSVVWGEDEIPSFYFLNNILLKVSSSYQKRAHPQQHKKREKKLLLLLPSFASSLVCVDCAGAMRNEKGKQTSIGMVKVIM